MTSSNAGFKKLLDENPCKQQYKASLACLDRAHSKADCQPFFDDYKDCMKKWKQKVREERLAQRK